MAKQKEREEAMAAKAAAANQTANAEAAAKTAKFVSSKPSIGAVPEKPVVQEPYIRLKKNLYAPSPKTERGKPVLLGGDPKGENILYCNGSDVIIRSLRNPLQADIYSEHPRATTVARYSPDRRYIASGDETGTVRIWNTEIVQGTYFKLQFEKKCFGGVINDIAWDPESQRIAAVGNGRETMGVVFMLAGGASAGAITGHAKTITSCDWRPKKPYRLVTTSEDLGINWFEGPPFKWHHGLSGEHSRFPNQVRFSPNGDLWISVGQDKVGVIGNGETGQKVGNLGEGHNGGIYGVSWNSQSTQVLTASGDRTCKIWDVASGNGKAVTTFEMGSDDVNDQQLGCLWQGDFLISVNLLGHLSYLDPRSGKVEKVVYGHQKGVQSVAYHKGSNRIYSGGYDSVLNRFSVGEDSNARVTGDTHRNSVTALGVSDNTLHSISMDDTYRATDVSGGSDQMKGAATSAGSRPVGLGVGSKGLAVTAQFNQSLNVIRNGSVVSNLKVSYNPLSVAIAPGDAKVAVGGEDNKVHLYSLSGNDLKEAGLIEGHRYPVTALAFSPDNKYIATGDKNNQIYLWNASDNKLVHNNKWVYHSAKVNNMKWSPNGQFLASCGLDTSVIVWRVDDPDQRVHIKAAHHGAVNDVCWIDDSTVATGGADASVRTWNIVW
eukprot:TRINITY_DN233_c0_g1_i1.p1 TRINITY_DN233_c0_g1~~TRINITY_DN233_c0_g1_i1.p1  ORF type:complete len:697 (-),score=186.30 TRINITY_DN233_c0_g1_i1:69-2051(-)